MALVAPDATTAAPPPPPIPLRIDAAALLGPNDMSLDERRFTIVADELDIVGIVLPSCLFCACFFALIECGGFVTREEAIERRGSLRAVCSHSRGVSF